MLCTSGFPIQNAHMVRLLTVVANRLGIWFLSNQANLQEEAKTCNELDHVSIA